MTFVHPPSPALKRTILTVVPAPPLSHQFCAKRSALVSPRQTKVPIYSHHFVSTRTTTLFITRKDTALTCT